MILYNTAMNKIPCPIQSIVDYLYHQFSYYIKSDRAENIHMCILREDDYYEMEYRVDPSNVLLSMGLIETYYIMVKKRTRSTSLPLD
jgi:hypothetical protein